MPTDGMWEELSTSQHIVVAEYCCATSKAGMWGQFDPIALSVSQAYHTASAAGSMMTNM